MSVVESLLNQAEFFASENRPAEAHIAFLQAIHFDTGSHARNRFGCYLTSTDRYNDAIRQFELVLESATSTGQMRIEAIACHNLASVYREAGEFAAAARWQRRSLAAEDAAGTSTSSGLSRACDLASRAKDAIITGNYSLAEKLLRRSLLIEKCCNSLVGEAADWGSLGLVALLRSEYSDAVTFLGRAYQLHRQLQDSRGAGCDLMNLASLSSTLGRTEESIRFLRRAAVCFRQADAPQLEKRAIAWLSQATRIVQAGAIDPRRN